MKKALVVLGAIVVLFGGAIVVLGRVYGVGPLATGAPPTTLYVAIARGEESRALEIEVLDLATGERQLLAPGRRVIALALSPDRRSLFIGSEGGTILELDAVRWSVLRELRLSSSGEVQRLVALPDGKLLAITVQVLESVLATVDLGRGQEVARLELGRRLVGKPALAGDRVIVPVADRAGTDVLLEIALDPLRIARETPLFAAGAGALQTVAPAAVRAPDGAVVALSPFSLKLAVFPPREPGARRDLDLARLFFVARPVGFQGDLELSVEGSVVHACVGGSLLGERYRIALGDLAAKRSGSECGTFARGADGTLYLGVRGRPELRILDGESGETRRTLPLAGLPLRLVG